MNLKGIYNCLDWIGRLPLTPEHKIVLIYLARRIGGEDTFVWPSLGLLSEQSGLPRQQVSFLLAELIYLGVIAPDERLQVGSDGTTRLRRGWTVRLLESVDRSNPLFSVLLRRKVWAARGLTIMERVCLDLMGTYYDWDADSVRLGWLTVNAMRPFITRSAWVTAMKRLASKGVLLPIEQRGNQHVPLAYAINLDAPALVSTEPSLWQIAPSTEPSLGQIPPSTGDRSLVRRTRRSVCELEDGGGPHTHTEGMEHQPPAESKPGPHGRYTDKGKLHW